MSSSPKRPFTAFEIALTPTPITEESWRLKDYRPIAAMGAGGVLFYKGHFAGHIDGELFRVAYDIKAPEGWRVYAFGRVGFAFENWTSPTGKPAFVYVAPDAPSADGAAAKIDDRAPEWIKAEAARRPWPPKRW